MKALAIILALALAGCAAPRQPTARYTFTPPLGALICDVGSDRYCADVWGWPDGQRGEAIMGFGIVRVRAGSYDREGRPLPDVYALGHETLHHLRPDLKEEEMPR